MLIHHTDCGMQTFRDDDFRKQIHQDTGIKPEWAAESFDNLEEDYASRSLGSRRARLSLGKIGLAASSTRSRQGGCARWTRPVQSESRCHTESGVVQARPTAPPCASIYVSGVAPSRSMPQAT